MLAWLWRALDLRLGRDWQPSLMGQMFGWMVPAHWLYGWYLCAYFEGIFWHLTKQNKNYPNVTTLQKSEVKMNNAGFIPQVCFATFSPKLFQNLKKSSKYQKCKLESKQQWPKTSYWTCYSHQKTWYKRNEDRCCKLGYTVAFVCQIQPGFHTRTCGVKQTKTLLYLEHFVFRGSLLRMQSAA